MIDAVPSMDSLIWYPINHLVNFAVLMKSPVIFREQLAINAKNRYVFGAQIMVFTEALGTFNGSYINENFEINSIYYQRVALIVKSVLIQLRTQLRLLTAEQDAWRGKGFFLVVWK